MDWSRAKTVLIFVLLALNIFLLANLDPLDSGSAVSKETVGNAVKILSGRGITPECEIPRTDTDPGKLTFDEQSGLPKSQIAGILLGKDHWSPDEMKNGKAMAEGSRSLVFNSDHSLAYSDSRPQENLDISNRENVEKSLAKYLDLLGLPASAYFVDSYKAGPDGSITVIYREKFKGYIVFENYLEITAGKSGVLRLQCEYKKIENLKKSGSRIIPAYQILLKEYGPEMGPAVITNIDLGFKESRLEQDMKEIYKQPVWRIRTGDGSERFFKASNGEEIK
ncbi:MAG: two-component system regulatory protein YycI [Clostridiales bacterium]|jgi:hypothetical protein|nr:two-component system regulatory protein YycI [Eubacteriales bacterium]MDH7565713.1 two-component system regulatory protein YycI [Clostridiales bacterium]